jgi:hypothetical protein
MNIFRSANRNGCRDPLILQARYPARGYGRFSMLYVKNVPGWERAVRVVAGLAMIGCGLFGLKGLPVGYLIAAVGGFTLLTGFVGFCPMCAMAGRRRDPKE